MIKKKFKVVTVSEIATTDLKKTTDNDTGSPQNTSHSATVLEEGGEEEEEEGRTTGAEQAGEVPVPEVEDREGKKVDIIML